MAGLHGALTFLWKVVQTLGSPVVPFCPFSLGLPLLKPNSRKKGTLIIKGLLGNLELQGEVVLLRPRDPARKIASRVRVLWPGRRLYTPKGPSAKIIRVRVSGLGFRV